MTALGLVERLYPSARIRELAAGQNTVFRITEGETKTSIVKVYPAASREKRERHALEALAGIGGVPAIIDHGVDGELAWLELNDGGRWNLSSLPKNLDAALEIEPPLATDPVPSHTRPTPSKFVVDDGAVVLVDWEWATLGPPEWDLTLAVWQFAANHGEDASSAFRKGYGAELPESRYRSWVAYHSAMMMLHAAETREGRLGDLEYLVEDLTESVLGS